MTARQPTALAQLTAALQPAVARLQQRRRQVLRQVTLARLSRRLPWLALLVGFATVVFSLRTAVPTWLPFVLTIVPLLLVWLWTLLRPLPPLATVDAALACDRAHDNKDRLAAACELAAAAAPDAPATPLGEGLAAAAIEDGLQSLLRIDAQHVALAAAAPAPTWGRSVASLLAVLLLPWLLPTPSTPPGNQPGVDSGRTGAVPAGPPPGREVATVDRPAAEPPTAVRPLTEVPKPAGEKRGEPPPPSRNEPTPSVPAASGAGRGGNDSAGESAQSGTPKAAPAGSPGAGRPGGGQGSAAAGAPEPTPETPKAPGTPPKKKPTSPAKPQADQEAKAAESAGAPSGPAKGSGRMAAVGNKKQDLNRGQDRDDDPEVEDEPIEDESEEQEQRGGVMPLRRQDQRPAGRELSISADGPPDQGRGGPTPPKKSRGTASLILGIRLPDSIRGMPNPGTAKTSLEQIPPRRQDQDPGLARAAAAGRAGTPQSPRPAVGALLPVLQAYYALLRDQDSPSRSATEKDRR